MLSDNRKILDFASRMFRYTCLFIFSLTTSLFPFLQSHTWTTQLDDIDKDRIYPELWSKDFPVNK